MELALNNLQCLMCHKTKIKQTKPHSYTHANIYNIYIYIYKLATVAEGYQKAPFSIATTHRCREGPYYSPCMASYIYP